MKEALLDAQALPLDMQTVGSFWFGQVPVSDPAQERRTSSGVHCTCIDIGGSDVAVAVPLSNDMP
jgi:hypothetical protein